MRMIFKQVCHYDNTLSQIDGAIDGAILVIELLSNTLNSPSCTNTRDQASVA